MRGLHTSWRSPVNLPRLTKFDQKLNVILEENEENAIHICDETIMVTCHAPTVVFEHVFVRKMGSVVNGLTWEQGLRQGYMLVLLLFDIFFTAMLVVAEKLFFAESQVKSSKISTANSSVPANLKCGAYRMGIWRRSCRSDQKGWST